MEIDSERAVLLGIRPQFAEDILSGKKLWEYRRVPPKLTAETILVLYASGDVQSIVGDCTITEILQRPINELMDQTIGETTSTREKLQEYFSGLEIGSAIRVENPNRYVTPISLDEIRGKVHNFVPPQNFYYLRRNDAKFDFVFSVLDSHGLSGKTSQKRVTNF